MPHSVLSPVPNLPVQVQNPPPEDSDSSLDSDYEPYDFSAQPPVALTTFYSECLGPGSQGPPCPDLGEEVEVPSLLPARLTVNGPH